MSTVQNVSKISREYNRGYTKAIQDFIIIFKGMQIDLLSYHTRLTPKLTEELLECFLENRAKIRDNFNGFIRFNHIKKVFEFFEPSNNCSELDIGELS